MYLSRESYKRIINGLTDGLYIVDQEKKIVLWNQAAERISGFPSAEVLGRSCSENILCHTDETGINLCSNGCPLLATMINGTSHEGEIFLHHKNGHRVPVSVHITPLCDSRGRVIGGVETFSDNSNKKADALRLRELEKLALLDGLTQLANRRYLERELDARLEEMNRYEIPFGVLFMDIDNFKRVNDFFGHVTGDRVLQFVAATFNANSRPFDLYGRWGGEEFVGIVRNVTAANLKHMGQRLRQLVEESFVITQEEELHVTISVGATMALPDDTISTLLQRADALMYQSKAAGRNRLTMG